MSGRAIEGSELEIQEAMRSKASLCVNLLVLAVVGQGLYRCSQIQLPPSLASAGHRQFLTNISAAVTLVNSLSNVFDFVVQSAVSRLWARHFTLPIALVLESVVASVYWPLRLFAMHLILQQPPVPGHSPIPLSVDLSIHLAPVVGLLIDHYWTGQGEKFRVSYKVAWLVVLVLGYGYKCWLELLIKPPAAYPYPFLNVEEPKRTVIFCTVTSFSMVYYVLYQRHPPRRGLAPRSGIKSN